MTFHIQAPARYGRPTANAGLADASLVYDSICKVLSDRQEVVDWGQFGAEEWRLLPQMARRERVGPLLYWHFKDEAWPPGIPKETAAALMDQYYNTLGHNTLLFQELDRILAAFDAADIPVIVLKGAALAKTLYPHIALRPMCDLDLLVRREDLNNATNLTERLGFWISIPPRSPTLLIGHHHTYKNEKNVILELHWDLVGNVDSDWRTPPEAWVWSHVNLEKVFQRGKTDRTLSTGANLLFLSAHLMFQHCNTATQLLWLYDIHLLISKNSENLRWAECFDQARKLGWDSAFFATLEKVRNLFVTHIPDKQLNEIRQFADRDDYLNTASAMQTNRYERTIHEMGSLDWSSRIRLLKVYLFPSPDYMRFTYQPSPPWLWLFYYPYRWLSVSIDLFQSIFTSRLENLSKRHPTK